MVEHRVVVALDLSIPAEEASQRYGAERDDHSWLDNRELGVEVAIARRIRIGTREPGLLRDNETWQPPTVPRWLQSAPTDPILSTRLVGP